jgi:hypothetical protein
MNDYRIVLVRQGANTGGQATAVAVASRHGAKAFGLEGLILQPRRIRRIQAGNTGCHTQGREMRCDLADTLSWSTTSRIEGADKSEEFQKRKNSGK